MSGQVSDNRARQRFELEIDGHIAFADYRRQGTRLVIPHVEAALPLRGTGAASTLMKGIMEIARREEWKVVPLCGFASAWLRRHKAYHDLLDSPIARS
jgi:predicted GNAT family acetyltransferase